MTCSSKPNQNQVKTRQLIQNFQPTKVDWDLEN